MSPSAESTAANGNTKHRRRLLNISAASHIECQTRRFCRDKLQHRYVEKSLLLRCKFVVFAKKCSGRALVSYLINLSKVSRTYVKPSSLSSRCATHDHQRHGWF